MKKSIIALSALLFLFVIFAAPTQADIMSWEDRAILRTQLESTPIGEADPWGEIESSYNPDSGTDLPDQESLTGLAETESTVAIQSASIIDESMNALWSLGGMFIELLK